MNQQRSAGRNRQNNFDNQTVERRKWSQEEDEHLIKLIKKYGTKNWRVVASHLKDRLPKQCRERFINHLDPAIVKGKLTDAEWNIVLESHEELGNKWSEISKLLPGRTPNQIKNHWHAMARREQKVRVKGKRKLHALSCSDASLLSVTAENSSEEDLDNPIEDLEEVSSGDSSEEIWEPSLKRRRFDSHSLPKMNDFCSNREEVETSQPSSPSSSPILYPFSLSAPPSPQSPTPSTHTSSLLDALLAIVVDAYKFEGFGDEDSEEEPDFRPHFLKDFTTHLNRNVLIKQ